MKHKHAELIKAWADGAEIEVKVNGGWDNAKRPSWAEFTEYRIKPEPKPDWSKHVRIETQNNQIFAWDLCLPQFANLVLTFEGETGELKSAEVLK